MFNTAPMTFCGYGADDLAIFREIDTPALRARQDGETIALFDDDGDRMIPVLSFKTDREV